MRIIFYIGHPAHFHYANALSKLFSKNGYEIHFAVRNKDIVLDLVSHSEWSYTIVSEDRFKRKVFNLLFRWLSVFWLCIVKRPSYLIGTDFIVPQVGWVLRIPSFVVFDDDEVLIPKFARLAFPFASALVAPSYCKVDSFKVKLISYPGFHKSIYMKRETDQLLENSERLFILRFVSLSAHHDVGVKGIGNDLALRIIAQLTEYGEIIVSSERPLTPDLEKYRKAIKSHEMHDLMQRASLLISDSQSMSVEAAMIGLPSLRINDFAGRIGVLNALENEYRLTHSVLPHEEIKIFERIKEILEIMNTNPNYWQEKVELMQKDQIDFGDLMLYLIRFYPNSINELRNTKNLVGLFEKKSSQGDIE